METPMIMTAGPTEVNEKVRMAMARPATNPDLDMNFFEFYKSTTEKLKKIYDTENDSLILNGEGMLGLDAAAASLVERGDRVLCIDNGIFGQGFGPLCETYGAQVVYFKSDYRREIDLAKLEEFLDQDHDFSLATVVHCETPSGILNPIEGIARLLNEYGILSIVDAVASLGGEEIHVDQWGLDIVLGASQKAISSPSGLSYISISQRAWDKMENRKEPIPSFYSNLLIFKDWYENKEFPYTQPVYNLNANDVAFDLCLERDYVAEHRAIARATRLALEEAGLELYAKSGQANTVTAVMVPEGVDYKDLFKIMVEDHNIMISGSLGDLEGKVFRLGHMGENARPDRVYLSLRALGESLSSLGFKPGAAMDLVFAREMNRE